MNVTPHYADLLQQRLHERIAANPRYSLRGFARDIGISATRLSQVLAKKQGLSLQTAQVICKKLAITQKEAEWFCTLVEMLDSRSKNARALAYQRFLKQEAEQKLKALQEEEFRVISDWHHFALIEALRLKELRKCPVEEQKERLAMCLDLPLSVIEAAVNRLLPMGLIRKMTTGRLVATDAVLSSGGSVPSSSIRKLNTQLLEQAKAAIECQTIEERFLSTLTIAVNKKDLPEIFDKIRSYRRDLNRFITERTPDGTADEVYCFTSPFFKLTAIPKGKPLQKVIKIKE